MQSIAELTPQYQDEPAALAAGPDFSAYPWPGLIRTLAYSYRLNLPDLRALVLRQIERVAQGLELTL